ncbi:shikimate dehydrogenase [Candidimonas sp. SYP-B2681]|uniref:shikimate dehydrogenase n=1 Tax=Candidimonas sp. SYP-B2681 TaxID=2497686 RepID=UPI000F890B8F|nr:shikimate dehydrogenase [Candidimonas sp. SYP-B2681]RTZ39911.1 shikimate dehydrogenase [Candidimonas sp. SYP-B2681]
MIRAVPFKRYAVIGNPIEHSRSPFIHEEFGRQTGLPVRYERIQAPLDEFARVVSEFFEDGGGLNITVPFKQEAFELAQGHLSTRARLAGAVNTLWMEQGVLHGCNTDGLGLLNDLERLARAPYNKKILLVGAGGAARGVVFPLLDAGCAELRIVNRSAERAHELRQYMLGNMPEAASRLSAGSLAEVEGSWDIVINATSSSLAHTAPRLPAGLYRPGALAYDMVYASRPTPFMQQALEDEADHVADGLGMLVAQAAASFAIWHGVSPKVEPVLHALRQQLLAA